MELSSSRVSDVTFFKIQSFLPRSFVRSDEKKLTEEIAGDLLDSLNRTATQLAGQWLNLDKIVRNALKPAKNQSIPLAAKEEN